MFRIVYNVINTIKFLTTFNSLLIRATGIKTNTDVLCLSIKDIMALTSKEQEEAVRFLNMLSITIDSHLTRLSIDFPKLKLQDEMGNYTNLEQIEEQLICLTTELKHAPKKTELQRQISLLEYYICLLYKNKYALSLLNVILVSNSSNEVKFSHLAIMLKMQAEYIIRMGKFQTNVTQYTKKVLQDYEWCLKREENEVQKIYQLIQKKYQENIEYFKKYQHTEEKDNEDNENIADKKPLDQLRNKEDTKTGTILLLLLATTGILFAVGVVYSIYKVTKPNNKTLKLLQKQLTKDKINITSK